MRGGVLATDLDGTLIPLADNAQNRADLAVLADALAAAKTTLVFVTGRHLELAVDAMASEELPRPDWLIADVGTSIYRAEDDAFIQVQGYQAHQREITRDLSRAALEAAVEAGDGLRLQEDVKQGPFKLSYYADAARLDELVDAINEQLQQLEAPWQIIHSVDPFNGDGLIDLLPAGVSKSYALRWWVDHAGMDAESIVFAGDSGNDLAALTAGYRAIVVGNAKPSVVAAAKRAHREQGWRDRLYLARGHATSGVLEGCRWYGLIDGRSDAASARRFGATVVGEQGTSFCVWAPVARRVDVELTCEDPPGRHALTRDADGYFRGVVAGVGPGHRYWFRVDGGPGRPDPASRYQPDGVHGPSEVIDPSEFLWTDAEYPGIATDELIICELHVGAFTGAGTYRAAIERLDELVDLGVTAVELMPVAQCPGRWNWGYDAVDLYAPSNAYGRPNDLKALIDGCHRRGLAVILDVVYNHLGPEGNYWTELGPYASRRHATGWGDAFNYDEPGSQHVRRFVIDNALYWLDEFHADGLRLDAAYFMFDDSALPIVDELARAVDAYRRRTGRHLHLIAETNLYAPELLEATEDRPAYDAVWCDCLMHSLYSVGRPDLQPPGRSYRGAADVATSLRRGWVYEGADAKRGQADRSRVPGPPGSLVVALQNHDQVGNHPRGERIHQLVSPAFQKAAAALVTLYPALPLVFMGEATAVDAPFPFFVDFGDEPLRRAVREGRKRDVTSKAIPALSATDESTFYAAKLGAKGQGDPAMLDWYRRLIALRKRGRSEGWLSAETMRVHHDSAHGVFVLEYSRAGAGPVVVCARLGPKKAEGASAVSLDYRGTVALHSAGSLDVATLEVNQAAVVVCDE